MGRGEERDGEKKVDGSGRTEEDWVFGKRNGWC